MATMPRFPPEQRFFVVIGAAKAATTVVCECLKEHPAVSFSSIKEPDFFSVDRKYALGWGWYQSLFDPVSPLKAIGEGSTSYSITGIHPRTVERLATHIPQARIIYLVRHPLDRLRSHVRQHRHNRRIDPRSTMFEVIKRDAYFIDAARYWFQLNAYRNHFADEQILVRFYEDFVDSPIAVLCDCTRHIEVDQNWHPVGPRDRVNSTAMQTQEPIWIWKLKRIPGVRRLTPHRVKLWVKTNLGRPLQTDDEWDAQSVSWVLDRIGDDIATFLRYCGRESNYWDMSI